MPPAPPAVTPDNWIPQDKQIKAKVVCLLSQYLQSTNIQSCSCRRANPSVCHLGFRSAEQHPASKNLLKSAPPVPRARLDEGEDLWLGLARSHLEVDVSGTLPAAVVHAPGVVLESVIAVIQSPFFLPFSLWRLMSLTFSAFFIAGKRAGRFPGVHCCPPRSHSKGLSHRCEGCQADK